MNYRYLIAYIGQNRSAWDLMMGDSAPKISDNYGHLTPENREETSYLLMLDKYAPDDSLAGDSTKFNIYYNKKYNAVFMIRKDFMKKIDGANLSKLFSLLTNYYSQNPKPTDFAEIPFTID